MNKIQLISVYRVISKLIICINLFLFVVHLFAPMTGGVFLKEGVLIPASIIGLFLITNIIAKRIEFEEMISITLLSILTAYEFFCAMLWFVYPFSLFFIIVNIIANYGSYLILIKKNKTRIS